MPADISTRPVSSDYAPYFERYVSLVPEMGALGVLENQLDEVTRVFRSVPNERESFRYAAGKWSVRQIAGHLIDSERVFGYRALCIARGEKAGLPGFDENDYMAHASFDDLPLTQLADEFESTRRSNLLMLRHLASEAWDRKGIANGNGITVRALAYVMAGHARHHLGILATRYI